MITLLPCKCNVTHQLNSQQSCVMNNSDQWFLAMRGQQHTNISDLTACSGCMHVAGKVILHDMVLCNYFDMVHCPSLNFMRHMAMSEISENLHLTKTCCMVKWKNFQQWSFLKEIILKQSPRTNNYKQNKISMTIQLHLSSSGKNVNGHQMAPAVAILKHLHGFLCIIST